MRVFNVKEAAKFIGMPQEILIRMRDCSTRREEKRGPPYCKVFNDGYMDYVYKEKDLIEWLKTRNVFITANDAAFILQTSRSEVLKLFGLQRHKVGDGELIIDVAKNFFAYIPKRKSQLTKTRKKK